MTPAKQPRPLRSFVRREGRFTAAQRRAFEQLWPRFGVNPSEPPGIDLDGLFGRNSQRVLEIGFGDGESLLAQAQTQPQVDFIGVEAHRPGIGHLLLRLDALALSNVRVLYGDAVEILDRRFAAAGLDAVQIFFPDPWPKKRHHKRRLIQAEFVDLLASRLKPGGRLHLATDWRDYAEQMHDILAQTTAFALSAQGSAARTERPSTKFERRGERLGHEVWDMVFQRC